jgi:hypothetical protein
MPGEAPVPISNFEMSDIRQALSRLENTSGRLEGLLEGFKTTLATITEDNMNCERSRKDLDTRMRRLEINQGKLAGAAAIVGTIAGWISYHVWPFSPH